MWGKLETLPHSALPDTLDGQECPSYIRDCIMKYSLAILLLLTTAGALAVDQTALSPEGNLSKSTVDSLRTELQAAVESGAVAGAAHLVVRSGKEIYFAAAGVRDIEEKAPFERDTVMRFYSMTKPITSVAAMTLYEQGKFELDDPVAKFIPAFAETMVLEKVADDFKTVPAKRQMTVRDVFRHTTGFAYGGQGNADLERIYEKAGMKYRPPQAMMPPDMTIEQAANALAGVPASHHPGERFTYGFSTDLLGRLIEVWSGKTLDVYLREAVLNPLEMVDTGFSVPADKRHRFASCHTGEDGKLSIVDKATTSPFVNGFKFLSGGGGLVSTIQDYSNFCEMMVNEGQFGNKRILKTATVKLIFTNQLEDAAGDFQFGLGFAINQVMLGNGDSSRKVHQYSWGGYASTDFRLVPEEKMFQIVVRQRVPSSHNLARKWMTMVHESIAD